MSFRDLESGETKRLYASKPQLKQRRDDESQHERLIKANIQEMQNSVRSALEQLERAQRSHLTKRMSENLDRDLERSRELAQETEQLFRDWTVQLAGEPSEKHRKKFSLEKLEKAFRDEMSHMREVGKRAIAAHQEAMQIECRNNGAALAYECHPVCEDQGPNASDEEHGLLDDARRTMTAQDSSITNRIAQEREEGIRRIQSQVSEVNQIFRDLASIVTEQGRQFDSIEDLAEESSLNTKQAVVELKKASDRQRSQRERLCCMLAAAILVLCLVLFPHMRT